MIEMFYHGRVVPTLSIVIPCFNEEEVLPLLFARLTPVLDQLGIPAEVLLVDDGSLDSTPDLMIALTEKDPRYHAILLSRNFGHQIALSAGLRYAQGDAVAVLDCDLQDPPELLGTMLAKWREGYDVVYGKRTNREGETWLKKMTAAVFYWVIRRLSGVDIPSNVGDFRLMDRKVVKALERMPERFRFLRGMIVWAGYKQYAFEFERPARAKGVTKYPWKAMLRFAFDAIFSFSVIPLRISLVAGLVMMLVSIGLILKTFYLKLFTDSMVPGFSALYTVVLTLGGLNMVILGIVGEYIGRIYVEVKNRPLFFVDRIYSSGQRRTSTDFPA